MAMRDVFVDLIVKLPLILWIEVLSTSGEIFSVNVIAHFR